MPAATVILPSPLLRLFPGCPRRLEVPAGTVGEIIDQLDRRWPGMRDRLCDSTPAIRRHINIFIGLDRGSLATPVPAGSELLIVTAISGG